MIRRPPRSTRTDTLFPYTTLFRPRTTVTLSALEPNLAASLDLMADIIKNPAFAPSEIERLRAQQLAGIASELTQPTGIALRTDRKSTRLNPVTNAHIVCRLLLEKKNTAQTESKLKHVHNTRI